MCIGSRLFVKMHSSRFILCGVLIIAVVIESLAWHKYPLNGGITGKVATDLNVRLPNHTVPLHYDIRLGTRFDMGIASFYGVVTIDFKVLEETPFIVLHARDLDIIGAVIRNGTRFVDALYPEYDRPRCLLKLRLPKGKLFQKGDQRQLHMMYDATHGSERGFVMLKYQNIEGEDRRLAFSRFDYTYARTAFPCYDEPNKKATFRITVQHNPDVWAVSNMPKDEKETTLGKFVFQKTERISPHMVELFASDFDYTQSNLFGIKQRLFAPNGEKFPLSDVIKMNKLTAEYFNSTFILQQLEHIILLASVDKSDLHMTIDSGEEMLPMRSAATTEDWINLFLRIAHGISHKYFGEFISPEWWNYLWMTEGFANLFSYMTLNMTFPDWDIWQYFYVEVYNRAMTIDASDNARPLSYCAEDNMEIGSLCDNITHLKGASILNMWRHALTDNIFRQSSRSFLDVNLFNATSEEDLYKAIQSVVEKEKFVLPAPIGDMMASWTQQSGYPVLKVTRNYENGCFTVSQGDFSTNSTTKSNKLWFIPFNYVTKSKADFRDTKATHYLLNETCLTICENIPQNDWLILNKQSTGYYRINYDERNWFLIIDALRSNPHQIHPLNRAQLLNDAYHLCKDGHTFHSFTRELIHRDLFMYMPGENAYAPWLIFTEIMKNYPKKWKRNEYFRKFIKSLTPIYTKWGVNEIPGETHLERLTRRSIIHVACLYGMTQCLQDTNAKLQDSFERNVAIEVNLQSEIYCFGIKQATNEMLEMISDRLTKTSDKSEIYLFKLAMECAKPAEDDQAYEVDVDKSSEDEYI